MANSIDTLEIIGGALCLDFANTVSWRTGGGPIERLGSYADLLRWLHRTGALRPEQGVRLTAYSRQHPDDAAATLARAKALREAIYRSCLALAADGAPGTTDLAAINAAIRKAYRHVQLLWENRKLRLDWQDEPSDLEQVLRPIMLSTKELLESDEQTKIRECAGEHCGWLFVDRSRNHLRRWCSMADCGNRSKSHRYYHRKRKDVKQVAS